MKIFTIGIIASLLFVVGCQHDQTGRENQQIGAGVVASGDLGENISAADSEVTNIGSASTDPTISAHVTSAHQNLAAAKAKLPAINSGLSAGAEAVKNDVADKATVAKLNKQFFSPRQIALFWWAVIIVSGAAFALVVCDILQSMGNPLGAVGAGMFSVVLTIATAGGNWIVKFIAAADDWIAQTALPWFMGLFKSKPKATTTSSTTMTTPINATH
jgi:hypothetical protein